MHKTTNKNFNKQIAGLIKDFYTNNQLSEYKKNKILHKLPMSQSSTHMVYKMGIGLLGIVLFMAGFFMAMPQKAIQYTPDAMLQYVPAKTQVAYVEDQEQSIKEATQVIQEVDELQQELNAIDAELSALDNLE